MITTVINEIEYSFSPLNNRDVNVPSFCRFQQFTYKANFLIIKLIFHVQWEVVNYYV